MIQPLPRLRVENEGLAYYSDSPDCALDEAAVGLAVSAWADGLRLGAVLALEQQAT
jgi:hypothetical protein